MARGEGLVGERRGDFAVAHHLPLLLRRVRRGLFSVARAGRAVGPRRGVGGLASTTGSLLRIFFFGILFAAAPLFGGRSLATSGPPPLLSRRLFAD